MSQPVAAGDARACEPDRAGRPALPLAPADRQQAQLFAALLAGQRTEMAEKIRATASALAHHRDSRDAVNSRRLQHTLRHLSRNQSALDSLCDGLNDRLAHGAPEAAEFGLQYDLVLSRRRTGWRLAIPSFNVTLANITSRTEAEQMGHSVIGAITGLPSTDFTVRVLVN